MMKLFDRFAEMLSHWVGHPFALGMTALVLTFLFWTTSVDMTNIVVSIVSLVLLFLLQHTQNRDGAALQAKLDELIKSSSARNRYIGLDRLSEKEIGELRDG